MAAWFTADFESPDYSLGALNGQGLLGPPPQKWSFTFLGGPGSPNSAINVIDSMVIDGLQSAEITPGKAQIYFLLMAPKPDSEVIFKFRFISGHGTVDPIEIGMIAGPTGWTMEFHENGDVFFSFGIAKTSRTLLGNFTPTTAREYKIRIDPTFLVSVFIDASPVFSLLEPIVGSPGAFIVRLPTTFPSVGAVALFDGITATHSLTVGSPTFVLLDDFIVRTIEAFPTLKKPVNVSAIRRKTNTIVSWNPVTELEDGTKIDGGIIRYDVVRFDNLNETDSALKKSVTIINPDTGQVHAVFNDTNSGNFSYRIRAIASHGELVLESELSDRSTAIELPTQIDEKGELIDRKLFVLGQSKLGEGVLA